MTTYKRPLIGDLPETEVFWTPLPAGVPDEELTVEQIKASIPYRIRIGKCGPRKMRNRTIPKPGKKPRRHFGKRKPSNKSPEARKRISEAAKKHGHRKSRRGVPDGMWREDMVRIRAAADRDAKIIIGSLMAKGKLTIDERDELGREVLEYCAGVVRSGIDSTSDRLKAAKMLLDKCVEPPVSSTRVTVEGAEGWLMKVLEDEKKAKE